jgi:uncharacterized protein (TIGR02246 family)
MMKILMAAMLSLMLVWGTRTISAQNPQNAATMVFDDRAGIEKLHQQDIAATFSQDPNDLADLFTEDGILLEPGSRAIVGRQAILAANQEGQARHPKAKILNYKPEIRDLHIENGWAFEWDYFEASFQDSPDTPVQSMHAKALRILKREPDGSWKFARVMWNLVEASPKN